MNKLPVEIAQNIIKQLNQQDIQQCMLICRDWTNWMRASHLFTTVCITTQSGLDKFAKTLLTNPLLGEQVRRLIIELALRPDFDINTLTQHLPGLRIFYFNDTSTIQKAHTLKSPQPWFDSIMEFIEESHSGMTAQLLRSGELPRLTAIAPIRLIPNHDEFIRLLSNAPSVSNLTLTNCDLRLEEMETIHSYMPSLASVKIKMATILPNRWPFTDIQPANQVTSFSLHSKSAPRLIHLTNWFRYIQQKYPHLTSFEYVIGDLEMSDDDVDDEDTDNIYNAFADNGLSALLAHYGPQLHTLSIESMILPADLFERLDEANCRIRHLKIRTEESYQLLPRIQRTKQRDSIQVLDVDMGDEDEDVCFIHFLTGLEDLRLDFIEALSIGPIGLNGILGECGETVTSLEIRVDRINYNLAGCYPQIQKLVLSQTRIPASFDGFLSVALPNVRHLEFKGCQFAEKMLNIPSISLDHFEIVTDIPQDAMEHVLVVSMKDQQCRWYAFEHQYRADGELKNEQVALRPPFRIIPYPKLSTEPSFTLICRSIRDMSIRVAEFL